MIIKLSKEEVYLYQTWRMKINPLKSFIEAIELNLICLALYRKEVCNESDKAYSNYLFNIFHSRNQWVERLFQSAPGD